MKIHPLANLFPDMTKDDFATLVADIKQNGLLDPISTYQGSIIDGKHRFKACDVAKIKPTFVEYTGDDPLSYVVSKNLSRRHLEVHDKALIAAKIVNGKCGGDRKSDQNASARFDISIADAAKILGVGERSINHAKKILEAGSAGLIAEVQAGKMPLTYGAAIAKLKKSEQSDPRKRKATIAAVRKKKSPNKEAPLNSHAWVCATLALQQKWISDVGVKSIWKAMTNAHREQLEKVIEEEEAEGERRQTWQ